MDWIRDHAWETWLGIAIVLAVAELASMDLVLLMLALGALIGMVAAIGTLDGVLQIVVAGVAAIAALGLVRPSLVRRLHSSPAVPLGIDRYVGKQAVVTERITGLESGSIRLDGETWTAAAEFDYETLEPGQTVDVVEIRGATAVVRPA
jgi:membrane protein implicated in regulation of membrane protease activity